MWYLYVSTTLTWSPSPYRSPRLPGSPSTRSPFLPGTTRYPVAPFNRYPPFSVTPLTGYLLVPGHPSYRVPLVPGHHSYLVAGDLVLGIAHDLVPGMTWLFIGTHT